ncbi:tetratricopeptide repeat protein [Pseudomonas borbori]|uniref:Tetratricopeptide repeat-containing protein n=1 Tax=Pseudomonas borbori TaxID=289003 RepID=A0A1I5QAS9_9PSED|nr:tetratricopeptide repeat protein [Pseudomonas borbori]SFP43414.1 Tetratricopeptide repeat-containing protein [Pseudomonas borbori]
MKSLFGICLTLLALCSQPSFALNPASETALQQLQQRWAEINYQLPAAQREAAFAKLAGEAEQALAREPDAAELLIWDGIIRSTWAGAKGGLGALGLAKQAKARFEQALALDPQALNGSAYTSLASLYYQVPGWPIGFGDDDKAAELFRQALAINPQGIDPNYFYAGFLVDQDRYAEARSALEKTLAAPDRPGRAIADTGRRNEARKLLDDVDKKLE